MFISNKIHSFLFFFFSFLIFQSSSFAGGLKFTGNDQPISKRTSYNVFDDKTIKFKDDFDLEFNLTLYSDMQIGYIARIKNKESNKVYNLFYDGRGSDIVFKLNEEGRKSLITAVMNKEELLNRHWFKVNISFDLQNDSISLMIHNQIFNTKNLEIPDKYHPVVVFGKSDHIIDVPSFAISNLSIGNNKETYNFPLNENKGKNVHDEKGNTVGTVTNPEWLINDSYHWKLKTSFKSDTIAGATYNPEKKEIYFFNNDSLLIYNVRTEETQTEIFDEKCPVKLILGTNFLDTIQNKLYAYEVYYDTPYNGPTVASLDLNNYQWTTESHDQLETQLHHHASFFKSEKKQYTIFGGFGNMHFYNNFYSYSIPNQEWQMLEGFDSDAITPRYFSSLGYLRKTNSLYIFGGMGNESGEQIVGRKYYYDLYEINLNTKHITKQWEIPWDKENVVPVRSMVIPEDSCFYTLCYPEHFTKSHLKLYRFSLEDGSYEILGDSIPIYSDKISTNAKLYFDDNRLYALIEESKDDISSELKVYSLVFPPVTAEELENYPGKKSNNASTFILIFLSLISALGVTYLLWKKSKSSNIKEKAQDPLKPASNTKNKTKPNSIFLFGDFTVYDRNNKDITYLFSTRLKQTFCVILQYSLDGGITSQHLSNIIWPDKPSNKVKNSRGVTINHLRKVLNEIDGIELIHEQGYFKLTHDHNFYCDYSRCMEIISSQDMERNKEELVDILNRGPLLEYTEQPIFDSFKETLEQKLEPILIAEAEKSLTAKEFQITIDLTEAIFNIDPLNEIALSLQIKALHKEKRDDEAKIKYQAFITEYEKTMGTEFPHSKKFKKYFQSYLI